MPPLEEDALLLLPPLKMNISSSFNLQLRVKTLNGR